MQNPWQEIKEKLNIVDIINEYVPVKQVGISYKCLCPFHQDKNPSLTISPDKGLWHCFGCGAGGDLFKFVMDVENISKREVLEKLAKKANLSLEKYNSNKNLKPPKTLENQENLNKSQISSFELGFKYLNWTASIYHKILLKTLQDRDHPVSAYCLERGLTKKIIETFLIGYAPKNNIILNLAQKHNLNLDILSKIGVLSKTENSNLVDSKSFLRDKFVERLVLPIFSKEAKIVGFTARNFPFDKLERPKYLNSPQTDWFEKSKIWYGWHLNSGSIRRQKKAIIVEGNMDVIAASLVGLDYCLASQGTSFGLEQIKSLKLLTKTVWLAFDNDEAGFVSGKKFFKMATKSGLEVEKLLIPKQFKDLDEWLKTSPNLQNLQTQTKPYLDFLIIKNQLKLQDSNLKIQKEALIEILDLLIVCDLLSQEHYLQKITDLTKKSLYTLKLELQNLSKNQLLYSPEIFKTSQKPTKINSSTQEKLIQWQNLVTQNLSQSQFDQQKFEQSLDYPKLKNLFYILQGLLDLFPEFKDLETYISQNLDIFRLIFEQKPVEDETKLWRTLVQFVDSQATKLFLDEDLKQNFEQLRTK
jgi:DNA primase catalytic core